MQGTGADRVCPPLRGAVCRFGDSMTGSSCPTVCQLQAVGVDQRFKRQTYSGGRRQVALPPAVEKTSITGNNHAEKSHTACTKLLFPNLPSSVLTAGILLPEAKNLPATGSQSSCQFPAEVQKGLLSQGWWDRALHFPC